jgi:hypothetical protein
LSNHVSEPRLLRQADHKLFLAHLLVGYSGAFARAFPRGDRKIRLGKLERIARTERAGIVLPIIGQNLPAHGTGAANS